MLDRKLRGGAWEAHTAPMLGVCDTVDLLKVVVCDSDRGSAHVCVAVDTAVGGVVVTEVGRE